MNCEEPEVVVRRLAIGPRDQLRAFTPCQSVFGPAEILSESARLLFPVISAIIRSFEHGSASVYVLRVSADGHHVEVVRVFLQMRRYNKVRQADPAPGAVELHLVC